mmetsp:Transcript_14873/g.28655  ORF Transcript_14873/g.28655 Transcript_14873/m.28655 type:complete len:411 (+) Transcript_14873:169-1401(+)
MGSILNWAAQSLEQLDQRVGSYAPRVNDDIEGEVIQSSDYREQEPAHGPSASQPSRSAAVKRAARDAQEWMQEDLEALFLTTLTTLEDKETELLQKRHLASQQQQEASHAAVIHAQEATNLEAELEAVRQVCLEERAAAAATRREGELRAASLLAEIEANKKAMHAAQAQMDARRAEIESLEAQETRAKLMEEELTPQLEAARAHVARVQTSTATAEANCIPEEAEGSGDYAALDQLRQAVEEQESEVAALEARLAAEADKRTKMPSENARVADLERRLGSLRDQLSAKQRQHDQLLVEKRGLEIRLGSFADQRSKYQNKEALVQTGKRNKISKLVGGSVGLLGEDAEAPLRKRKGRRLSTQIDAAVSRVDTLALAARKVLRSSSTMRVLLVFYVVSLHFVALLILYMDV